MMNEFNLFVRSSLNRPKSIKTALTNIYNITKYIEERSMSIDVPLVMELCNNRVVEDSLELINNSDIDKSKLSVFIEGYLLFKSSKEIDDIGNDLLTREQEFLLFREYKKGSRRAYEELVRCNQRLIYKIANKYSFSDSIIDDVIQDGNLGLIEAITRFDYNRGIKFSTYAYFWINNMINRNLGYSKNTIKKPLDLVRDTAIINKYINDHYLMYGKYPDRKLISKEKSIPIDRVDVCLLTNKEIGSLDVKMKEDGSPLIEHVKSDITVEDYCINKIYMEELIEYIRKNKILSEREIGILIQHYGLTDRTPLTLVEIAAMSGVKKQMIFTINKRTKKKLKESVKFKEFIKYI